MRKRFLAGLVLGTILLSGAHAQAGFITYLATGTFAGGFAPGTPSFVAPTDHSTTVTYTSTLSTATAPPVNQVSLGTFTTASGAAPTAPTDLGTSAFTMVITNTGTGDTISFAGTISGALSSSSSSAFVQFSGPLSAVLDGFTFSISSADNGVAGRINLGAPTANGGVTTVNGSLNFVPEPSTFALLGLGVPALLGLSLRRRMKAAQV